MITQCLRCQQVLSLTLTVILAISALGAGRATAQGIVAEINGANAADRVPEGLAHSDWSSIRAAYEAGRHAAFAVDCGYQARNPGQQWRTRFDGRGFLTTPDAGGWSWGLELLSYGRAGAEQAVTAPSCLDADGGRVCYQWDDALTEWYVNDTRGLEHGYTVSQRPEGFTGPAPVPPFEASPLQLTLAVRGGLRPRVSAGGRNVTFVNGAGTAVVNYHGLSVYDVDGMALPAWFEASGEALVLSVDDLGARYPLTIDPVAQQAYLKASNTDGGDEFGFSVGASGDTVVVGAFQEDSMATGVDGNQADNSANSSGAAYVFVLGAGGTWSQQAYLKASNTDSGDHFGISVAISGNTVVVGAEQEASSAMGPGGNQADNSAGSSGAAYVFVRTGTTWVVQAYLKASNTESGDNFGIAVAASGDTVVVGARLEDSNAMGVNGNQADNSAVLSGAAYVFVRDVAGVWSQQAYLKASNPDIDDQFGTSVAASGDTVVVGADRERSIATGVDGDQAGNPAMFAGAAYVFFRDAGGAWSQQAYLKASNTGQLDRFGTSVAASGDTVVVGAPQEGSNATGVGGNQADNTTPSAGAAYVFIRSGMTWSQQAYLKASNTGAFDRFGFSVAASGDTVAVGADRERSSATGVDGNQADNSAMDAGAAYVFARDAGVWSQQAYIKASNTDSDDNFGYSVAVSGDTLVVGAPAEDSSATGVGSNQADNSASAAGAAYVFVLRDCNLNSSPDTTDIVNGTSQDCNANGIPDECEPDGDGDGTIDACDNCPDDLKKTDPGVCGCGMADMDTDGDGTPDCFENCPNDPNKLDPGICGCGVSDVDTDGDGTPDCILPPGTNPMSQPQPEVFLPLFPLLPFPICGIGLIVPIVAVATGIWTMRRRRHRRVARHRSGR